MTEAEWLACEVPRLIWEELRGRCSSRKMRLWACGCCPLLCDLTANPVIGQVIRQAERMADGEFTETEAATIEDEMLALLSAIPYPQGEIAAWLLHPAGWKAARTIDCFLTPEQGPPATAVQRELFFCTFRPRTVDSSWLTPTVVTVAEGIYADLAFDRLPILADALQDAGCEDADILGHCRSDGPHVRGCWALDLVLGKE
ncbi:hypothetical protein [Limnoglobus roseus]|uniref:SMI1/KNR4 family protein n=1 Tax=Limnoglobus roseus TaxID=2598579 RepID=A0A5C1A549_9BACT|nr:hypothetical protein [Limnoglobus roseus]QEL13800.1 SMI1/KNR4 family protein [Limnoglobus roseus]